MATRTESRVVYAAGVSQGIVLVTFPAASTVFTDPAEYDLSNTQYGSLFVPQVITAIAAALLGAGLAGRFGTKRVYLAGFVAALVSMVVLIVSQFLTDDQTAAYALLLFATACLGVGFGLSVPALNTFAAAFHPEAVDRAILVLNALLGLGTVLAPVFAAIFVGLGFWWGLPVTSAGLLVALIFVSIRLPLQVEARRPVSVQARIAIPPRLWVYAGFAVVYGVCETVNGNWSQLDMTSELGASRTQASLALTAFLGDGDAGAGSLRRRPALASLADDLPCAAFPACRRVRDHRGAPRRSACTRRARLRPRRAWLLSSAAADDQLRARGAASGRGDSGGRRDRLLPAWIWDRSLWDWPACR